ncbi:lipid asymmetry maintenance protein MlaB [Enterobacteriaceae bacterium 4M9]|nr:lipid asymmetry maintenance protein MlaB [Enterobacteriaceae bacterium 4M9]
MADELRWTRDGDVLHLQGILEHETLAPLWQQRAVLMSGLARIDLSGLTRVDTAGLALLIQLVSLGVNVRISGASPSVRTLASLYNLPEAAFPLVS